MENVFIPVTRAPHFAACEIGSSLPKHHLSLGASAVAEGLLLEALQFSHVFSVRLAESDKRKVDRECLAQIRMRSWKITSLETHSPG